jgi:hypothetical protein
MEFIFDMVCTEKIQKSPERLNGKGDGLFQVYHLAAKYNRCEFINLGLDGEKVYSGRMIFPTPVKVIVANSIIFIFCKNGFNPASCIGHIK